MTGAPVARLRDHLESRRAAAGVTHFEVKFICHDLEMMYGMIRAYAEDVVPRLAGRPVRHA